MREIEECSEGNLMKPFTMWKYRDASNNFLDLENWMIFSIGLANYVKGLDEPVKVYISVPSNLLFAYFFVLGAIDYDFRNPSEETFLYKYLSLKKGQRILYKSGERWVAHSVLEVGKIPNSETRAIVVKDRLNATSYIPETRWLNYVRLYDNEVTKIRNIRQVRDVDNIGENTKLRKLYPEKNLNLMMMQNTPKTYLYTSQKEWKENLSVINLEIDGEPIQLSELLYDGSEGIFKNLSLIQNNNSSITENESTIIFVGSSRTLSKMDQFKQEKCVFIVDQHDSIEKLEELQWKIEQEFLMENGQLLNKEVLKYMNNKQIQIPKGVEIFAWASKS